VSDQVGASDSTGRGRIAALANRSRGGRAASGDAAGFEALLAEATSRESRLRQATTVSTGTGTMVKFAVRQRPTGALGPSAPMAADALAVGEALSTTGLTSAASISTASGSTAGEAVIAAASEHLGVPYLWGGTDPEKGFDCSGLIQHAYRDIGVDMPKWSRNQARMGVEVPSIDEALPGDIIAFGEPVDHVGLYVGDGQMLHAPRTGDVVKIGPIQRPIATIRRIVTPDGATPVAADVGDRSAAIAAYRQSTTATGSTGVGEAESRYSELFESAGRRWNIDPALLAAVAETESAFNPRAVSSAGAQGLMQFMPATAAEMDVDPWDPASAIDGAARYLRNSLDRFGSNELAIASYNAGPGAVARYGDVPPFAETQNYVRKVLDAWRSRS
jgi:cell wall-associated NlpC family hydrolase